MEASTSKDPPLPASTTPPTLPVRAASPPLVYVGDIPIITFENSLEDVIGEHTMKPILIVKNFWRRGENQAVRNLRRKKFLKENMLFMKTGHWKNYDGPLKCFTTSIPYTLRKIHVV
jgi:hypothetical protein